MVQKHQHAFCLPSVLKGNPVNSSDPCHVVISQTISWVSQVRLATVARISVFIE